MPRSFEEVQQNQLSEFIYDEATTFRCPSEPRYPSLPTPAPIFKKYSQKGAPFHLNTRGSRSKGKHWV